ncbi:hypothetical protein Thermus77420_09010 [Thermus thalpophilus]
MGVKGGMAKELGDLFLQGLADHVFQPLRLFVDFLPAKAQGLVQVGLEEPVVAQDLEGYLPSRKGQASALVRPVIHKTKERQLL